MTLNALAALAGQAVDLRPTKITDTHVVVKHLNLCLGVEQRFDVQDRNFLRSSKNPLTLSSRVAHDVTSRIAETPCSFFCQT